jgi:hypothetical protein
MATTTNYSWTTPDDTDLVKDGAAAIRTLGSSADTTVKDLNPGTTAGDIDYYTSSTAKARVAIGTAGQVLKVNAGGTAPEWATTADQTPLTTKGDLFTFDTADARLGVGANGTVLTADSAETTGLKWAVDPVADVITTAGDLIYGTAADTVARLGIGTAGQLLAVNSGATAPEWVAAPSGGGLTLLETLSLSGATTTSATLSSSYKNLLVVVKGVYLAGNGTIYLRMNTDTGNNYSYAQLRMQTSSVSLNTGFLTNIIEMVDLGNNSTATENGYGVINIYRYNDTDIINCDFNFNGYIAGAQRNMMGTAYYDNSAAISTISFFTGSTFSAGTAYIYGVA